MLLRTYSWTPASPRSLFPRLRTDLSFALTSALNVEKWGLWFSVFILLQTRSLIRRWNGYRLARVTAACAFDRPVP